MRRRTNHDELPPVEPLYTALGAFRNGDNEIRLAFTVTGEVVRGFNRPIHSAVAAAIGVMPGERRRFRGLNYEVGVAWRLSSTNGPDIGSLVLAFRLDEASVGDPGAALATSVGCPRDALEQTLRDLGDGDLADLIA